MRDDFSKLIVRRIRKLVVHPGYAAYGPDKAQNFNDLMLLQTDKPIDLQHGNIGTICVPEQSNAVDSNAGKECIAAGWGALKSGNRLCSNFHNVLSMEDSFP